MITDKNNLIGRPFDDLVSFFHGIGEKKYRAKQLMDSYNVEYDWTDIDEEPEFQNLVKEINDGKSIVPTIIFPDGSVLVEPSNSELIKKLNL